MNKLKHKYSVCDVHPSCDCRACILEGKIDTIKEIFINKGEEDERKFKVLSKISKEEYEIVCDKCEKSAVFHADGKIHCGNCGYLEIFF